MDPCHTRSSSAIAADAAKASAKELRLCDICTEHSRREDKFAQRIWTIPNITLDSTYCCYCAVLWTSLQTVLGTDTLFRDLERREQDTITVWEPFGVEGGSSARRCVVYWYAESNTSVELSIFRTSHQRKIAQIDPVRAFLDERIPIRFTLPTCTQSLEAIATTKRWLDDCMAAHHVKCHSSPDKQVSQPKRLVHVRKSNEIYDVRLVELESSAAAEYFCLSYRWGIEPACFTTTRANLAKHKHGIPWDTLPKLFRQALEFTTLLGSEYIWIDSLCIIQDDRLDWSQEAKKMADIYQNAKLTLAASWAGSSNDDMFGAPKESVLGIKVPGLNKVGVVDDVFVRVLLPHKLERFPLLSRAWVYQERLLSPRYLHFSPVELIWECNTTTTCQCSGTEIESERALGEQVTGRFAKETFWRGVEWNAQSGALSLRWKAATWNVLVQEYSSRDITYRQDRLPAIAGMAKRLRQLGQNRRYLAGLWEDTFVSNLMWQASSRSANMPRASEWIAPTWSWASAAAGVRYFGQPWVELDISDRIRLLDASCELVHDDATLGVSSAQMTISGPTFIATIQYQARDDGNARCRLEASGVSSNEFHADYDLTHPGAFQVSPDTSVLCMEAGNVTIYGEDGFGMHALVFRRLSNGIHERIGVAEWHEDIRKISDRAETISIVVI